MAHSRAASRPRYSATLLVATPIDPLNSSTSVPSGCSMRTPYPAGPGLPREPPSIYATIIEGIRDDDTGSLGGLRDAVRRGRCDGWDVKQDAVAVVALQDLLVLEDGVEHLRPQANVADRADAAPGFRDGDPVAFARDE